MPFPTLFSLPSIPLPNISNPFSSSGTSSRLTPPAESSDAASRSSATGSTDVEGGGEAESSSSSTRISASSSGSGSGSPIKLSPTPSIHLPSDTEEGPCVGGRVGSSRLGEGHEYNEMVKRIREKEYPQLRDALYLDSSALPPFPSSLLTSFHSSLTSFHSSLTSALHSNPHSHSPSSVGTGMKIEEIRRRVLEEVFGLRGGDIDEGGDEGWELVFTSGATGSLKLVGESFLWSSAGSASGPHGKGKGRGEYIYLDESHTSLLGIRDLAAREGAGVRSFSWPELSGEKHSDLRVEEPAGMGGNRLIGLPAQCNATGQRYFSLPLLRHIRSCSPSANGFNTYILLDASAYLSSSSIIPLSSDNIPYPLAPDLIAFSFYKIFGYPTGLGGLLVKKRVVRDGVLGGKRYWGGGTLEAVTASAGRLRLSRLDWQKEHEGEDEADGSDEDEYSSGGWKVPKSDFVTRMEDGTSNIYGILALPHAIDTYNDLFGSWEERRKHVREMTEILMRKLGGLRHGNGERVVRIYTNSLAGRWLAEDTESEVVGNEADDQGPIVNFNILTSHGRIIPPTEIDRLACISNIHLRSGRHCNTGFITAQVGAKEADIKDQYEKGMGCGEAGNGAVVTSSVRVSLGVQNTRDEVGGFVEFVRRFFVTEGSLDSGLSTHQEGTTLVEGYHLKAIMVYPIKSCGGQPVKPGEGWPITPHGLQYDREWIILNPSTGKGLSQKRYTKMTLIRPEVDLQTGKMSVNVAGTTYEVPLDVEGKQCGTTASGAQVCSDTVKPIVSDNTALNNALSSFLGVPCVLARQPGAGRHSKLSGPSHGPQDRIPLLLSNESPYLLLNEDSVDRVSDWIEASYDADGEVKPHPPRAKASSFRGNFIVARSSPPLSPAIPFIEDHLSRLQIGPHTFIPLGRCRRCLMVSIDQDTGEKAPETFVAIARKRRDERGRVVFGMHMMWKREEGDERGEGADRLTVGMPIKMVVNER